MSVNARYLRLLPDDLKRLRNDPTADRYLSLTALDRIRAGYRNEPLVPEYERLKGRLLDLGKHWQALHFLLTGRRPPDKRKQFSPLDNFVYGGTKTKWEGGYDPVRFLTPQKVRAVAAALKEIDAEDLRRRDLTALIAAELYAYRESWSAERLDSLIGDFHDVRDLFAQAAREGDVVLISYD